MARRFDMTDREAEDREIAKRILGWRDIPQDLRPTRDDFRWNPYWRYSGDLDAMFVVKALGAMGGEGTLSPDEVRRVASYFYIYTVNMASAVLSRIRALSSPKVERDREAASYIASMRPLVDALREARDRVTLTTDLRVLVDLMLRQDIDPL